MQAPIRQISNNDSVGLPTACLPRSRKQVTIIILIASAISQEFLRQNPVEFDGYVLPQLQGHYLIALLLI